MALCEAILSNMDTHLPEHAFSLTHGAFIFGVPSSRKRNLWVLGHPCSPCISAPEGDYSGDYKVIKETMIGTIITYILYN